MMTSMMSSGSIAHNFTIFAIHTKNQENHLISKNYIVNIKIYLKNNETINNTSSTYYEGPRRIF